MTGLSWWKLLIGISGVLLAVACGSSGGGSAGPGSATPSAASPAPASASPTASLASAALCADAAALRASLNKLISVETGAGAVNEIKSDLANVQQNFTAFVNNARGQWETQTTALKSALAQLQTAVKALAANPGASTFSSVVTATSGVKTATQNLLNVVSPHCPSASPSASPSA
jgi:hypothetical protein